ncbi:hypothetical protein MLD38_033521 [Melastoma candidum]|uniref:Uncharacterized protein n=1 Tax=Melastoma candidum TaxID=119954 RepID=A0ACB9M718_9MYRT|nr:hypothetical protein MLD38_033521 [Melastoma candidum]
MAANDVPCCQPMFWVYLLTSVALVCFAGIMSGLTLGLMSLSLVDLEILAKAGQPKDRENAAKILPLVKNQHLLLCTLLIGNAMAMEALPIFLDSLLPAWGAILISVTLILAFGEIIPQSVCSRYGLSVGAKMAPVVRLLIILIFPLSYPISKLLDWLLGKNHAALLRRAELKMFVDMHADKAGKGGELTTDETMIITGALDLTLKTAKDAMTPITKIFSLDVNTKLDEDMLGVIIRKGHSRVPIYSGKPTNIIGLILVKNLIKIRPEVETCIKDVTIRKIPRIEDCLPLYDILNLFQKGHSHMAAVIKCKKKHCEKLDDKKSSSDHKPDPRQAARDGQRQGQRRSLYEQLYICQKSPLFCSSEAEAQSPIPKAQHVRRTSAQLRKSKESDVSISSEELESMLNAGEEVIGIITLEDVIEELLQEEILDETDEYVSVHDKISIQMEPPRLSPIKSPGAVASTASHNWCSPAASRASSYHHSPTSSHGPTPILRSPIAQWNHPTFVGPTLYNSPEDQTARSPGICYENSPSQSPASRKLYEKLEKPSSS